MFIVCPKSSKHKRFYTTAHVMQEWEVNDMAEFNRVSQDCLEVTHTPDPGNIFTCAVCGTEAAVHPSSYVKAHEKAEKMLKKATKK